MVSCRFSFCCCRLAFTCKSSEMNWKHSFIVYYMLYVSVVICQHRVWHSVSWRQPAVLTRHQLFTVVYWLLIAIVSVCKCSAPRPVSVCWSLESEVAKQASYSVPPALPSLQTATTWFLIMTTSGSPFSRQRESTSIGQQICRVSNWNCNCKCFCDWADFTVAKQVAKMWWIS